MVALLVLFTILLFLTVDYLATRYVSTRVPESVIRLAGSETLAGLPQDARGALALAAVDDNTYLAPGHIWFAPTATNDVHMGLDKVLLTLLGGVECIYPHPEGAAVERGGPLLMVRNGSRALKIRSPIDGVITRVNHRARENPEVLDSEDSDESWVYELAPSRLSQALEGMKHGGEATQWLQDESLRLRDLSMPFLHTTLGGQALLADGGVLVDELGSLIGRNLNDREWGKLVSEFFGESQYE